MISYVLGGGCFWCLDAVYRRITGVTSVESGYAGGSESRPNYYTVVSGASGHAEVVRVTFDEGIIPSNVVLELFFLIHDPTTKDRQGADIGSQYRSIMFYADESQRSSFVKAKEDVQAIWDAPIVTEVVPLRTFFKAEEEHQDYFNKNPEVGYCSIVIAPKVSTAKSHYKKWFNEGVL